jgi:hypothetical protein
VATVEELIYVEAPLEVVYRLVGDLAQYGRYAPPGVRYGRALGATTDEPGARVAAEVRLWGPFWRSRIAFLQAAEPPRCAVVAPPSGDGLWRWTLEPEPPGTVVTLSTDLPPPTVPLVGALVGAWRAAHLARAHRDLLLRLKALAEAENPVRR